MGDLIDILAGGGPFDRHRRSRHHRQFYQVKVDRAWQTSSRHDFHFIFCGCVLECTMQGQTDKMTYGQIELKRISDPLNCRATDMIGF